eukprot:gene47813-64134_t
MRALVAATQTMPGKQRSVVISGAGDRRDEDIREQTQILGQAFDDVILYQDAAQRGRTDGEVIALLKQGLEGATRTKYITEIHGEFAAIDHALERLQPGDTLFIAPRPPQGPRLPLAVLRLPATTAPTEFTLGDEHAMAADHKLSGQAKVVVEARVSRSGNAMPQAGDVLGRTGAIASTARGVRVVVDQRHGACSASASRISPVATANVNRMPAATASGRAVTRSAAPEPSANTVPMTEAPVDQATRNAALVGANVLHDSGVVGRLEQRIPGREGGERRDVAGHAEPRRQPGQHGRARGHGHQPRH